MRGLFKKISYCSLLNINPYEKDPGYKELLRSTAQQGFFAYGLLGTLTLLFHILSPIFIIGKTIAWMYHSNSRDSGTRTGSLY